MCAFEVNKNPIKTDYTKYMDNKRLPHIFSKLNGFRKYYIITSLLPKTNFVIDNISTKLIKIIKSSIKVALTRLINKSLENGIFPQIMKIAKVIPLYKGNTS